MKTVFISYVIETYPAASQIAGILSDNGFDVWIDKTRLQAGQTWINEIRTSIRSGSYFIPLFSKEWNDREKSVANDELLIAIEELRRRPYGTQWLMPVKLNDCRIPNIPIDATRTLMDLHHIDFSKTSQLDGFRELLRAMGVDHPKLGGTHATEVGWPFHLKIIRNDKYVKIVPFRYWINNELILESAEGLVDLKLARPGNSTVYCECTYVYDDVMQSSPGMLRGCYYRGISEKLSYQFASGHRYELFVSGDDIWKSGNLTIKLR